MSDERLKDVFGLLEASDEAALGRRVVSAWSSAPRSLWRELSDVLRARPLVNGAWVTAAVIVVVGLSPLGSVYGALPRLAQLGSTAVTKARQDTARALLIATSWPGINRPARFETAPHRSSRRCAEPL